MIIRVLIKVSALWGKPNKDVTYWSHLLLFLGVSDRIASSHVIASIFRSVTAASEVSMSAAPYKVVQEAIAAAIHIGTKTFGLSTLASNPPGLIKSEQTLSNNPRIFY